MKARDIFSCLFCVFKCKKLPGSREKARGKAYEDYSIFHSDVRNCSRRNREFVFK